MQNWMSDFAQVWVVCTLSSNYGTNEIEYSRPPKNSESPWLHLWVGLGWTGRSNPSETAVVLEGGEDDSDVERLESNWTEPENNHTHTHTHTSSTVSCLATVFETPEIFTHNHNSACFKKTFERVENKHTKCNRRCSTSLLPRGLQYFDWVAATATTRR